MKTCQDRSDQVFIMHEPCNEKKFVKKYNESICSGVNGVYVDEDEYCHHLDDIIRDYNNNYFYDPHQCTNSCEEPGYGCLACTNPRYFKCTKNNQSVCIHPDLHCNHHPDCDDAEDEKYEDCKNKYVEKFIVKEFATLRCPSKIYPNMETVATVCDDIIECHNWLDESDCKHNDANIYLAISVSLILAIYFGLKFYFSRIKNKQSKNSKPIQEEMSNTRKNCESGITTLRPQINFVCLHIKNSYDNKAKKKIGLKIYAYEERMNKNETMVFTNLHNNYLPEVASMVIDAKFPGFIDRYLSFLHTISDCINSLESVHKALLFIGKSFTIFVQYSDIFKDIYILLILIKINGGPRTLYDFPLKFSSMIIMCMATTIVAPLLISSIQLAISSNPGLVFNSKRKDKWSMWIMRVGVILTSFVNPVILKIAHENIQEKIREYLKTSGSSENLNEFINHKNEVKKKLSRLLKVDLGLELIYQISLQLILVLLSISKTPTTSGLEAFFKQTDNVVLILLTCWSFKTCVLLQRSAIKTEKVFFPFTSQLVILFWSTVAAGRRIMAIIVFFLPGLGLFSILNHWKAEQLPFMVRLNALNSWYMTPSDIIILNNMTRNVSWTSIDRWEYNSSDKPQPPSYTLYTGLSLGNTFVAFLILMALQLIAITVIKINTAKGISKKRWFNFMVHILENINIAFPYNDWDTDNLTVAEFKLRLREVNMEMAWTYFVNFIFNILMFSPFWWTGKHEYELSCTHFYSYFLYYYVQFTKFLKDTSF